MPSVSNNELLTFMTALVLVLLGIFMGYAAAPRQTVVVVQPCEPALDAPVVEPSAWEIR